MKKICVALFFFRKKHAEKKNNP